MRYNMASNWLFRIGSKHRAAINLSYYLVGYDDSDTKLICHSLQMS
jgi:hypothetical protein